LIFMDRVPSEIRSSEIEALVQALGTEVGQSAGSRVRVALKGVRAVFHRPRPSPLTKRRVVRSVRDFFEAAGATPAGEQDDA
jgi:hypothetical protein